MRGKDFNSVKPYVYWIKNKTTGIKYFGVRWANLNSKKTPLEDLGKKYFSSGTLKRDFIKNPENFAIKIIATFDTKEEARNYEYEQNKKNIRKKRYANISAYPHIIHTLETRKKMSLSRKGINRPLSEETKRKIGLANKGRKYSEEYKKIMSKRRKGIKPSKESIRKMIETKKTKGLFKLSEKTKRKIGLANKGRKYSEEYRRKMSERLKGRKLSEEIRKKLKGRIINEKTRRAVSLAHKGKKLSEEHRTKISKAKKGTKQSKETLEKLSIIRKKNYENSHVKKINEARIARLRRKLAENPNYLKEQKRLINKRWRDKKKFKQSINV